MIKYTPKHFLKWFIAPTLFISDHYKTNATSEQIRGYRVQKLNKTYFCITLGLLLILTVIREVAYNPFSSLFFLVLCPLYCFSRCNEIFMAFIKDAFDKLNPDKRGKNGLQYYERIHLALRSYLELILDYAILYYILDTFFAFYQLATPLFNKHLGDLLNAIYFSVITIVAIGYGEYYPIHCWSKILVMYEIITGSLLLVVSFTVYVNLNLKD